MDDVISLSGLHRTGATLLWREALGIEVRLERVARSERILDVATRAGIASQYLSEIERGLKDPSSAIFEALAGALAVSTAELARRTVTRLQASAPPTDLTSTRRASTPGHPGAASSIVPVWLVELLT